MKKIYVGLLAAVIGVSMSIGEPAMARGGGHGGGHVSFSHSSGRSLFGTSTKSGSGLGTMFKNNKSAGNSVLGNTMASRASGANMKSALVGAGVGAGIGHATAQASTNSTSSAPDTSHVASTPAPATSPSPSYAAAPSYSQPSTVIVHDNSDNGFMNGMIMGSIMSHHDDSRPVIINNTPAPTPVANPVQANTNPVTPVPNTQQATTQVASATPSSQTEYHGGHPGLAIFIVFLLIGAGFVTLYIIRKRNGGKRTLGEHVVDQVVSKVEHRNDPTQQDMSPFVNPLGIKIPVEGSSGTASVISLDLDVRVKSMDAAGHFPAIEGKTFTASAYTKLICDGPLEGACIERIYLDDASMFLEMAIRDGKVLETNLYTNIQNYNLSEDDWSKVLTPAGKNSIGRNTFTVPSSREGEGDVVYTRLVNPEVSWEDPINAEEDIMTPQGTDQNFHKFMVFERVHGDMSEFLLADARYDKNDDDNIEDAALIIAVGIPVAINAVHVA